MKGWTREKFERKVWTHTHRDFRGTMDGVKTILVFRNGTTLVSIDQLTDTEILERLPLDLKEEFTTFLKGK